MPEEEDQDPFEKTVIDPLKVSQKEARSQRQHTLSIILTVMSGKDVDFGKNFSSSENLIRIGRDKDNDFVLDDTKVSKCHCEIEVITTSDLEQIIMRDNQSTNGTYINGVAVEQMILKSGDKIEIGETVIRFSYNDEIEEQYHSKLFTFASTDSLTGLYNKRYILNELENQVKIARRNNRIFCVILMDIDDFKVINDTHGHLCGDEYLKDLATTIQSSLREQDASGRFGGEEFLIVLPETLLSGAFQLANRIRKRVEKMETSYHNQSIQTTISAGVSQFQGQEMDVKAIIKLADHALYSAKLAGKNRVVSASGGEES